MGTRKQQMEGYVFCQGTDRGVVEIRDGKFYDGEPAWFPDARRPDGFYWFYLTDDHRIRNGRLNGPHPSLEAAAESAFAPNLLRAADATPCRGDFSLGDFSQHTSRQLRRKPDDNMTECFKGLIPESWLCIDCGVNTAPGLLNRTEMEKAVAALGEKWNAGEGVEQSIGCDAEVYMVRDAVWKRAGMEPMGGCLCIGCLERRLGRTLKPKDFLRGDELNSPHIPGTPRLLKRRKFRQAIS